jgi:hypothetical protein
MLGLIQLSEVQIMPTCSLKSLPFVKVTPHPSIAEAPVAPLQTQPEHPFQVGSEGIPVHANAEPTKWS